MDSYDRDALAELIRTRALKFGDFTLVSGRKAKYYLDAKQVTLDSRGALLVGQGLLALVGEPLPKAVGGLSIGADPMVAAMVTVAGMRGLPLLGFMVRKEPKGHGTNRSVEGPVQPGDECVIVDDAVTTAGSAIVAIERAEEFGLRVRKVVAIVDRLEGGGEALARRGLQLESLFTVRDFGIEPPPAP